MNITRSIVNNEEVENNSPISFEFEGDHEVRVIADEKGDPWFVASDVSSILGYSQTNAMNKLIDNDDKAKRTILNGGNYVNQSLISESGMYQAIFGSTLPTAKRFKKWVTSEVLPSIRKTGSYQTQPLFDVAGALENMDDKGIQLVNLLNASVTGLMNDRKRLTSKIEEDAPKVLGYDQMIDSEGLTSINDCAKIFNVNGLGGRKLFAILREEKILQSGKSGTWNVPYQRFINSGYFVVKNIVIGNGQAKPVTKVTPKGQGWIFDQLVKLGYVE